MLNYSHFGSKALIMKATHSLAFIGPPNLEQKEVYRPLLTLDPLMTLK